MGFGYTLLLLLTIGFIPNESFAQTTSVRVVVSEDTGTPLPSAVVSLQLLSNPDDIKYSVTNRFGFAEFKIDQPGRYNLKVSFLGFEDFEKEIGVGTETIVERVELTQSTNQLDEVVVSAKAASNEGQVGRVSIGRRDLQALPSLSVEGDLSNIIQALPSVITVGDRGGDIFVRGGSQYQNLYLVDDMPIVKPFHISNLFSAFSENVINSADFYAGGFNAEYMNATSSVLDIELKPGNTKEFRTSASFSPYASSYFVEFPTKEGRESLMLNARRSNIDISNQIVRQGEQDIAFQDIVARYSLFTDGLSCNVTGILTSDEGRINPDRDLNLQWTNSTIGFRCFGFDDEFDLPLKITAGTSYFENSESTATTEERRSAFRQTFLKTEITQSFFGQSFKMGGNVFFYNFEAETNEQFSDVESFDTGVISTQAFIQTAFNLTKNISVEPSLGSQIANSFGPTFEPRIRAVYAPEGSFIEDISFAAGRYFQVADGITDQRDAGTAFVVFRPNDVNDAIPSSTNVFGSISLNIHKNGVLKLETYYKQQQDVPVARWTLDTAFELETTLAEAEAYGADLIYNIYAPKVRVRAAYGYNYVEYQAGTEALGAWLNNEQIFSYNPAHDQRHKGNILFQILHNKVFTSAINFEVGSGQPYTRIFGTDLNVRVPDEDPLTRPGRAVSFFDRPFNDRLPYYHRLDFSLTADKSVGDKLGVKGQIGALNIYNRRNIFYFDATEFRVVNQIRFLPYASIKIEVR